MQALKFVLFLLCSLISVKAKSLNETWSHNEDEFNVTETILKEVNASLIRDNLQFLTKNPHLAGTIYDDDLADYIEDQWSAQGLDLVKKVSYESVLSYPDSEHPNKVHLIDANNDIIFSSKHMEDVLRSEDQHKDFVHMYNAYGANGTVEGDVVYAHYARPEDFKTLIQHGINVTGKIVIAKYGVIYRGNKVKLVESYGGVGLILFSDPSEYAQSGQEANNVYPNSYWLQSSGIVYKYGPDYYALCKHLLAPEPLDKNYSLARSIRIVALRNGNLESLTPKSLFLDGAYRIPVENADIPGIPCQPIGYGDAKELLKLLGGEQAPKFWQEPNATHLHMGPGFKANSTAKKVRLVVNNQLKTVNVTNVIGIIRGSNEPDRYVLAGNHRDAWGYGAVDASSGTAQMLEVTRVLGNLVKQGWRPKRSFVFCSWGGEEFGLIGSTEWVEENLVALSSRAVAYVNTDICTSGDVFTPSASPFLHHFIVDISKQIPAPNNNSATLYDAWREYHTEVGRRLNPQTRNESRKHLLDGFVGVRLLGGGTDHVPFAFMAGIAAIDLTFNPNKLHVSRQYSQYPAYHTGFDTFHLVDNYIDPGFNHHKACGHLNGLLLHNLADADILPFNVTYYAQRISQAFQQLKALEDYDRLSNHGVNIDLLEAKIEDFVEAANEFQIRLSKSDLQNLQKSMKIRALTIAMVPHCASQSSAVALRAINDQILHLDQTLLLPQGLPLQTQYRHVVFSLSLHNFYGSSAFPGIQDLLYDIDSSSNADVTWTELRKHVSDVIIAIHRATQFLKPPHVI